LTEVSTRELTAGAGFQIALELNRGFLFVELDADEPSPWPMSSRVWRQPSVVRMEAIVGIGRHANVVLLGLLNALQDVHEPFRLLHAIDATKCGTRAIARISRAFRVVACLSTQEMRTSVSFWLSDSSLIDRLANWRLSFANSDSPPTRRCATTPADSLR